MLLLSLFCFLFVYPNPRLLRHMLTLLIINYRLSSVSLLRRIVFRWMCLSQASLISHIWLYFLYNFIIQIWCFWWRCVCVSVRVSVRAITWKLLQISAFYDHVDWTKISNESAFQGHFSKGSISFGKDMSSSVVAIRRLHFSCCATILFGEMKLFIITMPATAVFLISQNVAQPSVDQPLMFSTLLRLLSEVWGRVKGKQVKYRTSLLMKEECLDVAFSADTTSTSYANFVVIGVNYLHTTRAYIGQQVCDSVTNDNENDDDMVIVIIIIIITRKKSPVRC